MRCTEGLLVCYIYFHVGFMERILERSSHNILPMEGLAGTHVQDETRWASTGNMYKFMGFLSSYSSIVNIDI